MLKMQSRRFFYGPLLSHVADAHADACVTVTVTRTCRLFVIFLQTMNHSQDLVVRKTKIVNDIYLAVTTSD